jgi:hypothetical protein
MAGDACLSPPVVDQLDPIRPIAQSPQLDGKGLPVEGKRLEIEGL